MTLSLIKSVRKIIKMETYRIIGTVKENITEKTFPLKGMLFIIKNFTR